jgi:hypothetical protein
MFVIFDKKTVGRFFSQVHAVTRLGAQSCVLLTPRDLICMYVRWLLPSPIQRVGWAKKYIQIFVNSRSTIFTKTILSFYLVFVGSAGYPTNKHLKRTQQRMVEICANKMWKKFLWVQKILSCGLQIFSVVVKNQCMYIDRYIWNVKLSDSFFCRLPTNCRLSKFKFADKMYVRITNFP